MSRRFNYYLPLMIALPITLVMPYILTMDQGSSGIWGAIYNRLYILLAWLSVFGLLFAITRRRWFATGMTSLILASLWISAAIKYQYLGSQLVAPDLVVAFLSGETLLEMGLLPTLAITSYCLLLLLLLWLENPLRLRERNLMLATWVGAILGFATLNLPNHYVDLQWTAKYKNTLPTFVQSIWRTQLQEPEHSQTSYCCFKADTQAESFTQTPPEKPNIVVILEESTFPLELIPSFKAEGEFFKDTYPLKVHTTGGATWVQEIAFLHGVAPPLYGDGWKAINLFTPGRLDGRIAPQLAAQGYRTKTIYPTAGRFYGGQRFHEQLGIQEFIDCKALPKCAKRSWNSIPDEIFFDELLKQVKTNVEPLFTFVATMRQHSPHEKNSKLDTQRCDASLSAKQCSILLDYNERLKLSVTAHKDLLSKLKKLPERTIVVTFGDHIPGDVAANFTESDFYPQDRFRTFFNVWDSKHGFVTRKVLDNQEFATIDIAMLDALTLRYAGFESSYISDKLVHMQKCSGSFCAFDTDDSTALTQLELMQPLP
ncbi:sulfatase-like hydrolase/transferase [Candidatus Thiothrix anitrata]|jgi:phosphoglycerol transferase MdoB-like AlkP superfamily enzyme|uniref:Sulfatase-like hydrolase/transferase n=1 Tax=Candidatus Thiothrix anitrata TaxID=2823902 RepID=A0ABX7X477_9GAMM|nr:sulfatase-like hydrolase/transferase [Candidatus Thiothrix anitrata]QTR50679.1 sulfatase-like hydrolase/transferase [Candidatus Thiothrix anitrata]